MDGNNFHPRGQARLTDPAKQHQNHGNLTTRPLGCAPARAILIGGRTPMTLLGNAPRRAVTLTELLVVVVIISLLATIAVPVYIQKVQQARVAVARAETRNIAEAMMVCAATHGFVVPIHILDNVPTDPNSSAPADDFSDAFMTSRRVIRVGRPVVEQIGNQDSLGGSNDDVVRMRNFWAGPFLQPQRVYIPSGASSNPGALTSAQLARDFVLDPWGSPYVLYSDRGVIGGFNPTTPGSAFPDLSSIESQIDNGLLTTNDDRFDRFAVVSYGPDGFSGGTSNAASLDDVYYLFNPVVLNETSYSIF
jgi:prepilin-type N-terminal cleavage/methylation domain-containing protein